MIRPSRSHLRLALPVLLLPAAALVQTALVQTALVQTAWAQTAPPTGNAVAPRNPGVASTGIAEGDRARTAGTVDGIDRHLLRAERDRPRLPNQAPTASQTLPGGTASGQPR